jgi:hypothetical protein
MVAKIKRVIVASILDVDKNTERPVTIRALHAMSVLPPKADIDGWPRNVC